MSTPGTGSPRTVVVAPNWVGDTVMAFPVLEALAASGRVVEVLARPHLVPLLERVPAVAAAVAASDDAQRLARLREGRYDEAVLLPNSFRSARLARRAGIPARWGYRGGFRSPLLAPAVARPPTDVHQVEDYAPLLAAMGVEPPGDWTPRLELGPEHAARGAERLARAGIDIAAGPIVGLFPGAEFGASKQWPRERFEETARQVRRALPEARLTILAGPKETWLAVRLHEETGKVHPVLGPDLDLADLAAVLSHHRVLVTNDSGPMHLAAAVGVRCVALFGPTDPSRTAPTGEGHHVVTRDRWCAPCFRRRCPLLHHRCLRDIEADEVVSIVERTVAGSGGSGG